MKAHILAAAAALVSASGDSPTPLSVSERMALAEAEGKQLEKKYDWEEVNLLQLKDEEDEDDDEGNQSEEQEQSSDDDSDDDKKAASLAQAPSNERPTFQTSDKWKKREEVSAKDTLKNAIAKLND